MTDERWQKVREVFDSALRRQPEERSKYVIEICGADKSLFAEVESFGIARQCRRFYGNARRRRSCERH